MTFDSVISELEKGARRHPSARTSEYLYNQLIPYIGNKRNLLWLIARAVERTGVRNGTFVDFFAGSSVVSRLAKTLGFRVIANDWEPYSKAINHSYIACPRMPSFKALDGPRHVFESLNSLPGLEGYVATRLCPADDSNADPTTERMFFTRANGMRIDAMREQICTWEHEGKLSEEERSVLLASLIFAVSYTANTSGVFKGFHHGWGGATGTALYRILSEIRLRAPVFHDNGEANCALALDAKALADDLAASGQSVDIAYLDPPYNQHPYGSNYHVLNTVTLWDKPEVNLTFSAGDKAAIRTDWRTDRRSLFNSKSSASRAFDELIQAIDAGYILTSYSTDGNIPLADLLNAASTRGALSCVVKAYKRYRVSSQRQSKKPMNVEFVLIVDTRAEPRPSDPDRIHTLITDTERMAISAHAETVDTSQLTLIGQ